MKKKFIQKLCVFILITVLSVIAFIPVLKNINYGLDLRGGFEVLYKVSPLEGDKLSNSALMATYKSITKRIDSLGVSEPEITIERENIRIKLAGVTDENTAKERLSTPAVLSFRDTEDNLLMDASVLNPGGASLSTNQSGKYVVALDIKNNEKFYQVTKEISKKSNNTIVIWLDFNPAKHSYKTDAETCGALSDSACISSAGVQEAFSSNVVIEGNFTKEEAQELVDLINSGSLPTKLTTISSKTVDASFGNDTLVTAGIAGLISLSLIILLLTSIYKVSGFISGMCLIIYTFLVFLLFNAIEGVLTLPGIAAMILGIGMAVDSCVISLERIKDELKEGISLSTSVKNGDKSSFITILDANITTFLIALILFIFGESSVKGFATVLILTIIVTMFTMVLINRVVIKQLVNTEYFNDKLNLLLGFKNKKKNKESKLAKYDFTAHKITFIIPIVILLVAIGFYFVRGINLGIDFTGGSSINVMSLKENIETDFVKNILNEYNVIDTTIANDKEIYFKISEKLPEEDIKNIKSHLSEKGYESDISVISNTVKKDLTKNAFVSLLFSFVIMLIYVGFRFTFNFSFGAIIALLHDILMMVAAFIILNLQINFIFIAALLTIIGYSINDTIVTFDRIRENYKKLYKSKVKTKEEIIELANISLKQTFFRTILTSISTLIPIITLLAFDISSIYEFNISLLAGLVAGVYSSIFIAVQLWVWLSIKDLDKPEKPKKYDEVEELSVKGINA